VRSAPVNASSCCPAHPNLELTESRQLRARPRREHDKSSAVPTWLLHYSPPVQVADHRSSTATLVAAFIAMACGLVSLASFELILVPLQTDLMFSVDNANALIFMPAAASLLVVFVAGSLADRWGPRRPLLAATALYLVGAVLVGLAPNLGWVVVGRVLDGVGGVTMAIVALSVINSGTVDAAKRARLFGIYAAVAPAMFIVSPALAALIADSIGWRAAVVPWVLVSAVSIVLTLRHIPHRAPTGGSEVATPLLAGLVLAALAMGILQGSRYPAFGQVAGVVAIAALILLIVLMRRLPNPALNLRWCRGRGMVVLLVALAVASMPNLFFYTKLLLQYRYTVPLLEIALLMALPQAFAITGGLLSGPVSARVGPTRAAIGALLVSSIACLGVFIVTGQSPIWVPVLALCLSAGPIAFVVGPMTNVLLSRAPADASGNASSLRKATWTLGGVVGGALVGALSFSAFQSRMTDLLANTGLTTSEASALALQIRDGAIVDELAATLENPAAREALIARGPGLLEAQTHAFMVMGVISSVVYLVAAALMLAYLRRSRSDVDAGVG
jgi:predicted MFS family arabinose efflux permease